MQDGKRIKICLFVTKGVWGGAQKYVYTLATKLPTNKYDVFVICGAGNILKEKLEEKRIRVYELDELRRDISVTSEIRSFFKLFTILQKESPDILHLSSPKAGGLGALMGRILSVPNIIYTAHGWSFNEKRNVLSKSLIAFFSWITVLLCHKVIVIAEKEKIQALKMPMVNDEKITLIRNGIEPIKFINKTIVQDALRGRLPKDKIPSTLGKKIWIGTIAELHKNKGLEYAVVALSKIKTPFVYFILGGGEEIDRLQNLIRHYALEDKVFLVGFIENANLYLKAFDIFILPSIKEGLPYTLLEAGLASLPVISTAVGGIPDIIQNGKNGILVTKAKHTELNKAIENLIGNLDKRKKLGEKLKQKVEKEFSEKQMIEKTTKLYTL